MSHPTASPPPSQAPPGAPPPRAPRWAVLLATGLGAGFLPIMPGTYGSAEGVVLSAVVANLTRSLPDQRWWLTAGVAVLIVLTVVIIALALPHFTSEDPQPIVLDEVAGQSLTLLPLAFLPARPGIPWIALGAGFLLFRIFDALKPYPIWKLGNLRGAWGVLADDLGAAVVGAAILYALVRSGWM